jgi:uncharacterized protein (TIGR03435 family)
MPRLTWIVYLLLPAAFLFAQTPDLPSFDVASVKLSGPNPPHIGIFNYPGGRISGSYLTLEMLISEAFNVQDFQISGGPAWTRSSRFDIEAKPPVSSKLNPPSRGTPLYDEQRQMLQVLLADRFQLKVHRETKQGPVYLLVKGSGPLKLEAPKDPNAPSWAGSATGGPILGGDGIAGTNISMPELASRVSWFLRRPVLDRTGLRGSFDFKFKDPVAPSLEPEGDEKGGP